MILSEERLRQRIFDLIDSLQRITNGRRFKPGPFDNGELEKIRLKLEIYQELLECMEDTNE